MRKERTKLQSVGVLFEVTTVSYISLSNYKKRHVLIEHLTPFLPWYTIDMFQTSQRILCSKFYRPVSLSQKMLITFSLSKF